MDRHNRSTPDKGKSPDPLATLVEASCNITEMMARNLRRTGTKHLSHEARETLWRLVQADYQASWATTRMRKACLAVLVLLCPDRIVAPIPDLPDLPEPTPPDE